MVSKDLEERREMYTRLMHTYGTKTREEIGASVSETHADLHAIFSSASDDQAARKLAEDEWCLHELAQHTVFTERLIAKVIHHAARGETPSREDLKGAGIGMMPTNDGRSYRELLDAMKRVQADLLDAVRALPDDPNIEMKLPHPFFGPLTCYEWAGFQRVHDTDHIQHAQKIIASTAE